MLLDRCPVRLSVYNVGVLWPNGWMDQDETWHAGSPRPHCVRWVSAPPPPKGHSPQFSAHNCCGQMAGWITMQLGREVGLGPSDIVSHGDSSPLPKKGAEPPIFGPCLLWPNGWTAGWIKMPLGTKVSLGSCHIVLDGDPSPLERGTVTPLFLAHVYCGHDHPSQLLLALV